MKRYAERIAGISDPGDILEYVAQNKQKIEGDLLKMLEYATCVYEGPAKTSEKVCVYISGSWMFIIAAKDHTVITLFKKDLGVDDERFNKSYMMRVVAKIEKLKSEAEEADAAIVVEADRLAKKVEENEAHIVELRKEISDLETLNQDYRNIIRKTNLQSDMAWRAVREFMNHVLGTREF
ncbi:MAG: hypothetical protein FWD65_08490 [Coriobacteriia bacterium]|nr:hypothetical protein [Coriobacteriia bacterium]